MNIVTSLTDKELQFHLKKGAALYSGYADTDLLFIYRHSRNTTYQAYAVHFGKRNFMHLAGIKSKTLSALGFYQACLDGIVERKDCSPCHSVINMFSKIVILPQVLDLKHCKLYKIGEKNLVARENDFEMATGNELGMVGYDSRVTEQHGDKVNVNKLPIPTTLINSPITKYCSQPEKIMYVLQKNPEDKRYSNIFYEIKKGLFEKEKYMFSGHLAELIC